MATAYSLEDAETWFLANSSGTVTCVKENGEEKICQSYPEAKAFFESE